MKSLQVTYVGGACDTTINTQDDDTCEDFNGGPPVEEGVSRIFCDDTEGENLHDAYVYVGDEFSIEAPNGGDLPSVIQCIVFETQGSTILQTVTFFTNNDVDLYLKDRFGSLRLEACDNYDCTVDITYFYEITNIGDSQLSIVGLEVTHNGNPHVLLDDVEDKELPPGEFTIAREKSVLDVCVDKTINTIGVVEGKAPDGYLVDDMDMYKITVAGNTPRPTAIPTPGPSFVPTPGPTKRPDIDVSFTILRSTHLA